MASFNQSFRHRTENPLPRALALRLTEERVAFKFRRQALVPETEDDQKLTFVPWLLNDPEVLRLPDLF